MKFRWLQTPLWLSLILLISLSACGKLGTGVLLWPPENSHWQPGDVISIEDESFLRKTYIVNLPNQRRLKAEIDQWRIKIFDKESEAVSWASSMNEWRNFYAECMYQGLPMRSEPSNLSEQVYRFRKDDLIKILGREPGPIQVGNLEGYWYQVLAYGGVEGYVFDYHLQVMSIEGEKTVVINSKESTDPTLDNFLARPWQPKYYNEMLVKRQINLDLFRPEYGLFIDKENKTLSLRLPGINLVETWSEIVSTGANRYDFLDTSFRVTVNSDVFVSVQYNIEGTEYFEGFIRLATDVGDIIQSELTRQKDALDTLINNGPSYKSRSYGKLTILDEGQFLWSGKSTLIARKFLSLSAGNSGNLRFDLSMDTSIAQNYDDAVSMVFENGDVLHFLHQITDEGLRLLLVPENAIQDKIVLSDQYFNPIQIFFTRTESELDF